MQFVVPYNIASLKGQTFQSRKRNLIKLSFAEDIQVSFVIYPGSHGSCLGTFAYVKLEYKAKAETRVRHA